VAAPTYLCMTIVFLVVFYVAYNFMLTPPLDSIHTITGGTIAGHVTCHSHVDIKS